MAARSFNMATSHSSTDAFRHGQHGHGGRDGHSHAHPEPHPHPHPHHPRRRRRPKSHAILWLTLSITLVLVGLVAAGIIWRVTDNQAALLVEDMLVAAERNGGPTRHALGGRLYTKREGDHVTVVALDLSQKDCVQAGWALVKRGIVTINTITPQRVSAAVLADLCAKGEESARLEWSPRAPE